MEFIKVLFCKLKFNKQLQNFAIAFILCSSFSYGQGQFGGKVAVMDSASNITWYNTNSQTCDGAGTGNLTNGNSSTITAVLGDKFYLGGNVLTFGFGSTGDKGELNYRFYETSTVAPAWSGWFTIPYANSTVCGGGTNKKYEFIPVQNTNTIQTIAVGNFQLDVDLRGNDNGTAHSVYTSGNYIPFTVSALQPPTLTTAKASNTTSITLDWSKWNNKNVMIVRSTANSFTVPTNGTFYTVGTTFGTEKIVYNSNDTSFIDTGLLAGTTYYYAFYSENYSYYSSAINVTTSTTTSTNGSPTVLYTSLTATTPEPINSRFDLTDSPIFRFIRFQANQNLSEGAGQWAFTEGTSNYPLNSNIWRPTISNQILSKNNYIPANYNNGAKYNSSVGGFNGLLPAIISGNYYTFNVSKSGYQNCVMQILETTYNPVTFVSQNNTPLTGKVNVITSNPPSVGEYVYIRYSSDNWTTSKLIEVVFTGSNGTVYLPVCVVSSTTINYYIYSSNKTKAQIEADALLYDTNTADAFNTADDMNTLNLLNNGGINYNFTFGSATVTYNGTTWSDTLTDNNNLIFDGDYTGVGISGCSCTINTSKNVVISSGTLALLHNLTVNGTLTFENNASLLQINSTIPNIGNISYKRATSSIANNYDYVYWGTPVQGQTLSSMWMVNNGGVFYSFDASINDWALVAGSTTMTPGIGYIAQSESGNGGWTTGNPYTSTFFGAPNNGSITTSIYKSGSTNINNLISNPYPCALDLELFYTDNAGVISPNFYFWTHNTAISNGTTGTYTSSDYATYNAPLQAGIGTYPASSGGNTPDRYVDAAQGFFVEGIGSGGTATFKNSQRVSGNNNAFYRSSNIVSEIVEKELLWLNLSNDQGLFKQQLVGYVQGATNDLDALFDAKSFEGNPFADFYSVVDTDKCIIQSRSLPFQATDVVALGYSVTFSGEIHIALDHFDTFFDNQNIYLEDSDANMLTNLKTNFYTFTTQSGTFNNRFKLRYLTNEELHASTFGNYNTISVFHETKGIRLISSILGIAKLTVFDTLGRKCIEQSYPDQKEVLLTQLPLLNTIWIAEVELQNGQKTTLKLVR